MQILVATPLEAELVDRIRQVSSDVNVLHEPELLPPPRYPADHQGDPNFRRDAAAERRFAGLLGQADVLLGVPSETPESLAAVVRANSRLRWIQAMTAGAGDVVRRAGLTEAELERVIVTTSSGVHGAQLAEWACFGLLAFTKNLPRLLADKEARRWSHYAVRELQGQSLLLIGLGGIGRAVAERAAALGMRVVGVRRSLAVAADAERPLGPFDQVHGPEALPTLVPAADAVVLALPGTPGTNGLFNRALIDRLPAHAIVVNVGRGSTIDEAALIDALSEGRIAGAALDVSSIEPLPQDSPLWKLPNVLISPHTASVTSAENGRIVDLFCDNVRRFLQGRPLRNVVDIRHYY
jgi:phosphoglycerate dehydrogenase-like enzyme